MNKNLKRALSVFDGQVFLGPRTSNRDKYLNTPIPLPPNLPNFDVKIVLTKSFRSDSPIALEKGGHFRNYREILDDIALKRVILAALENAKMEFVDLPIGVRLRDTSKECFWFNYSSRVQKTLVADLKPGGVFIESIAVQ